MAPEHTRSVIETPAALRERKELIAKLLLFTKGITWIFATFSLILLVLLVVSVYVENDEMMSIYTVSAALSIGFTLFAMSMRLLIIESK